MSRALCDSYKWWCVLLIVGRRRAGTVVVRRLRHVVVVTARATVGHSANTRIGKVITRSAARAIQPDSAVQHRTAVQQAPLWRPPTTTQLKTMAELTAKRRWNQVQQLNSCRQNQPSVKPNDSLAASRWASNACLSVSQIFVDRLQHVVIIGYGRRLVHGRTRRRGSKSEVRIDGFAN